jgi:eukaryotic-like serine/threonine-protein kinase
MLTGRVLFERDGDLEKLWAHVHDRPPRLPQSRMPPMLQRVLDRALAKDAGHRQQSAAELADEISAALAL